MSNSPPPVPPANRSDKGPGSATGAPKDSAKDAAKAPPSDPDKTGQQGNSALNTTHKGYQQDR